MINRIIRYYRGYLYVQIKSDNPERFFNLCAHNQILLWDMKHEDDCYCFYMRLKDFFVLKQFHLKTRTKIKILKRHGLPFFFQRNRKRKAFFLGFLLFAVMIYMLSVYIWNIHVEGNTYYSTQRILSYLETQDIHHGIRKNYLDCAAIAAGLRQEFPKITWVSAKIEGTQLILEIKENDATDTVDTQKNDNESITAETPCDIIAPKDGTIIKIFTRSGRPLVKEEMECKKGEILISGKIDIMNDALEVVRKEYVHADADIYIETAYAYFDEFPMNYKERIYLDEVKTSRFFKVLNYYIDLGKNEYPYEYYDQYRQEQEVHLTENFILPVSYGTVTTLPYIIKNQTYTKEQAEEKANKNLFAFLKKLSQKGVEIQKKSVKINTTANFCKTTGKVYVIEKTGRETPVQEEEPPAEELDETTDERTPVDE